MSITRRVTVLSLVFTSYFKTWHEKSCLRSTSRSSDLFKAQTSDLDSRLDETPSPDSFFFRFKKRKTFHIFTNVSCEVFSLCSSYARPPSESGGGSSGSDKNSRSPIRPRINRIDREASASTDAAAAAAAASLCLTPLSLVFKSFLFFWSHSVLFFKCIFMC